MKEKPPCLPATVLITNNVTAKLLYLYLRPEGWVKYSERALANALGMTKPAISNALERLEQHGLIEYRGERRERVTPTYRIKPQ